MTERPGPYLAGRDTGDERREQADRSAALARATAAATPEQLSDFNERVAEQFTWQKARAALARFENLHWRRQPEPRICIPVQPDDDDVVLGEALRRGEAAEREVAEIDAAMMNTMAARDSWIDRANAAEARVAELESALERWLEDATGVREQAAAQSLTERTANNQRVWELERRLDYALQDKQFYVNAAEATEARVRELEASAETARAVDLRVIRAAMAQIDALIAAGTGLREYADHLPECPYQYLATVTDDDCDCGYLATDAAWERAKEGRDG